MTQDDQSGIEESLREAILQLSPDELWSFERLKALHASSVQSGRNWEFESLLDSRRRVVSRQKIVSLVQGQPTLQAVFRRNDCDDFSYTMGGGKNLLDEYDRLKNSPDSALRYFESKLDTFDSISGEEMQALRRLNELRSQLDKLGIQLLTRDELISTLTDFDLAIKTLRLTNEPVNSVECPILEPIASYLAKQEIQNSYSTRYFAICFLNRLRIDALSRVRAPRFLKQLSSGAKAHKILTQLIDQLSYLNAPSTCDGRELIEELRKVQKLNIGVPSLLFSLFRLILPGV